MFKPAAISFLSKALGEDGLEQLQKFEIWKKKSNTAANPEEIKTGLQIVPRTILSLLRQGLDGMKANEGRTIRLPVNPEAELVVTKFENDSYSGDINRRGETIASFKYRTIPGIGLVIMSTFELYDLEQIEQVSPGSDTINEQRIQAIVDERLGFMNMVNRIVDNKLTEREAINQLMLRRLNEELGAFKKENVDKKASDISSVAKIAYEEPETKKDPYFAGMANGLAVADAIANDKEPKFVENKKIHEKLKRFIEKKKTLNKAFSIEIAKGETVSCPDCGHNIFNGDAFSGCICLGEDREKKVFIKKQEDKFQISFSRSWDAENIEMLLETLKERNNRRSK